MEKYKRFRAGEEKNSIKIDLNRNFRSKVPVLECTNMVMETIMTEESCGISYDEDAKLYPGKTGEELTGGLPEVKCELHVLDKNEIDIDLVKRGYEKFDSYTEMEAAFACAKIRECLGKEYYDSKAGEVRTIGYKDIVILSRSVKGASDVWQEVLRREGIPAYVQGDDEYFETMEISVFCNLLKIIENRRQDIPLISVLRSVIFGFSSGELARIRGIDMKCTFAEGFLKYAEEGPEDALREKCADTLKQLDQWKQSAMYMSLRDFLWKVLDESGYYDFVRALPRGAQRKTNLTKLVERGADFQSKTSGNLVAFVKYLEKLELNSAKIPSVKPGGDEEDFVRIMTIHKSKGLEFPVVIICGLGKGFNNSSDQAEVRLDKSLGLGMRFRSEDNSYSRNTDIHENIKANNKLKSLAEEMRVLYVAMTRAKEKLIMTAHFKPKKDGKLPGEGKSPVECNHFVDWLYDPMVRAEALGYGEVHYRTDSEWAGKASLLEKESGNTPGSELTEGAEETEPVEVCGEILPEDLSEEEFLRIRQEVYSKLDFKYGFEKAAETAAKYTATELNRIIKNGNNEICKELELPELGSVAAGAEQREKEFIPEVASVLPGFGVHISEKPGAAERGTINHGVLERIDPERAGTEEEIAVQLEEMLREGFFTERELGAVRKDWIVRFFASELGTRMRKAEKVWKEQPFLLWMAEDDRAGSVVQGIIDCFFEEPDGLVLLDYKTDFIPSDATEEDIKKKGEGYRTQLSIYKRAIEESSGKTVKEMYLYFLSIGRAFRFED